MSTQTRAAPDACAIGRLKLVDVVAPTESLGARLLASRAGDTRKAVQDFQALLESMLILDPARRCSVSQALSSAFIKGV